MLNAVPGAAVPGAVTEKCVAAAPPTVPVTLALLFVLVLFVPETVAVFVNVPFDMYVTW
jgi:hypothetical protein